jgi:hypothetical protein
MNNNGGQLSVDEELREIEAALRALTLRVATLRAAPVAPTRAAAPPPPQPRAAAQQAPVPLQAASAPRATRPPTPVATAVPWVPTIGDRVSIRINGVAYTGTISGFTPKRVKVSVPGRGVFLRAPQSIEPMG